MIDVTKSEDS